MTNSTPPPTGSTPSWVRGAGEGPQAGRQSGWTIVLLAAGFAFSLSLIAALLYQRNYDGRIMPGVSLGGIDLGGQTPAEALVAIEGSALDPEAAITLGLGEESRSVPPAELGLAFDARQSVEDAYAVGRRGSRAADLVEALWVRWSGRAVPPVVRLDEATLNEAVDALAKEFDRPAVDSGLTVDGTTVEATPSSAGRYLNVSASVAAIRELSASHRWPMGTLTLPVGVIEPSVTDATPALGAATALLQAPISLTFETKGWWLRPADLAPMLRPYRDESQVRLGLDLPRLAMWLGPVSTAISRTAEMPLFHFNEEAAALELVRSGRPGATLDLTPTAEAILTHGGDPGRLVPVAVTYERPPLADTVTAAELGIRELVRSETSRFVGSPPERIHNIGVAAKQFDGRLVPPGAVFSFNETIGDITEETGYVKTKVIMDGTTALGVGGGVCQVSTTLFRAAFWLGFPILERQAHGYRVAYYEQGAPVGLDATVYSPSVDFKFQNDSSSWLLIETSSNPRAATLTFRVYGTKPAREVKLEGPRILGTTEPPAPREEFDPKLAPGQTEQVELARKGASVTLSRVIIDASGERREAFPSRYRPTGIIVAHGPKLPEPPAPAPVDDEPPGAQDGNQG